MDPDPIVVDDDPDEDGDDPSHVTGHPSTGATQAPAPPRSDTDVEATSTTDSAAPTPSVTTADGHDAPTGDASPTAGGPSPSPRGPDGAPVTEPTDHQSLHDGTRPETVSPEDPPLDRPLADRAAASPRSGPTPTAPAPAPLSPEPVSPEPVSPEPTSPPEPASPQFRGDASAPTDTHTSGQPATPERNSRVPASPASDAHEDSGADVVPPAAAMAPTAEHAAGSHSQAEPAEAIATAVAASAEAPPAPSRTATILAIANQKGGVGKTTTTVSLAAAVAEAGHRVLVVDLDPQGNASTGLGTPPEDRSTSTYEVLLEEASATDTILQTAVDGLDLLPASLDLAGAEIELVPQFSRESRLRKALAPLRPDYDLILIDCPPSLGLLTINALVAADRAMVPIQCEFYALEGLGQLMKTVNLVTANLNQQLALGGIALTMFDGRTNLSQQVVDEVRNHFGELVFDTVIPRTVRLSEAPSYGQPITVFDSASRGARSYRRLAQEVAARFGLEAKRPSGASALDRLLGPRPDPLTPTAPAASEEQDHR